MKLDGATIPIEPRGFGECFDLASRIWVADRRQLAALTAVFAVPALVFAWAACELTRDGLLLSLGFFYLLSPILGAVIVAGEGPRVFGEPFRVDGAWAALGAEVVTLLRALLPLRALLVALSAFLFRAAPAVLVVWLPLLVVMSHGSSYVREVALLERLRGSRLRKRVADLGRSSHGPGRAVRYLQTALVCGLISLLVFGLADFVAEILVGFPLVRLGDVEPDHVLELLGPRVRSDPRVVLVLQAILWTVYPLARLTLFLDYLDVRIRKECWDVELEVRIEAARLEGWT